MTRSRALQEKQNELTGAIVGVANVADALDRNAEAAAAAADAAIDAAIGKLQNRRAGNFDVIVACFLDLLGNLSST